MNNFFRDYVKKFLSSDQKEIKINENKEQDYKENEMRKNVKSKMKKVNIFDKLKFNKLNNRLNNRIKSKNMDSKFSGTSNFKIDEWLKTRENLKNNDNSKFNGNSKSFNNESKSNSNSKSNQNLNIEKLKEAALVVTAVVLIGIGYVNFSGNKSPIETIDKIAKSTNNIGDVELVSSNAVLVDNEDKSQRVDKNNGNQNSDKENSNASQQSSSEEENKDKSQQVSSSEENTDNNQQQAVVENEDINKSENVSETEKNSNASAENSKNEEKSKSESSTLVNSSENKDDKDNNKETTKENESNTSQNYFAGLKLERNDMYSKSLETYQKIVDSSTISGEQKSIAIKEIEKINQSKNSISVAEELIKLKGFEDVVIYTNDDSISVIVKVATLSSTQVAQIQNIVSRELGVEVSKINISNKK